MWRPSPPALFYGLDGDHHSSGPLHRPTVLQTSCGLQETQLELSAACVSHRQRRPALAPYLPCDVDMSNQMQTLDVLQIVKTARLLVR